MIDKNQQDIEYLLLLENNPIPIKDILKKLPLEEEQLLKSIEGLNQTYSDINSIYRIIQIEDSLLLSISEDYKSDSIKSPSPKKKISKVLLEILAIIAYKQPVTKLEIDQIRGVDSGIHLKKLLDKNFITVSGKKEVVGRPNLYSTTHQFLLQFKLKSLSDLPPLQDIKNYDFLEE